MLVGPDSEPGEESFDLTVCTPKWLVTRTSDNLPLVGRHHLIVNTYDWPLVERFLRHLISLIEAPTWPEVATKISRLGHWEFEDYG
jgi:hypothetical protein